MKTLDEVIKFVAERQKHFETFGCFDCHYNGDDCVSGCVIEDALHYLKQYRSDKAQYEIEKEQWETAGAEARKAYEATRDKYIARLKALNIGTLNEPLSWNELKQLEGKPVWVEVLNDTGDHCKWEGQWMLVNDFAQGALGEYCHMYPNYRTWINTTYGDSWQAYRKERG